MYYQYRNYHNDKTVIESKKTTFILKHCFQLEVVSVWPSTRATQHWSPYCHRRTTSPAVWTSQRRSNASSQVHNSLKMGLLMKRWASWSDQNTTHLLRRFGCDDHTIQLWPLNPIPQFVITYRIIIYDVKQSSPTYWYADIYRLERDHRLDIDPMESFESMCDRCRVNSGVS